MAEAVLRGHAQALTAIDGAVIGATTIVALASGRPPAAIAIVRISGPQSHEAVAALTAQRLPPVRRAGVRRLVDPRNGAVLDDAMVLLFAGPASATGEDVAELHLHGGTAVVAGVLGALAAMPGIRTAAPGEFTRRSFANNRLDLAQVEGLADLVAAETAAQREQALALAGGALSQVAAAWREQCLALLAEAEASLDFAEDEADVAARLTLATRGRLSALAQDLADILADAGRGARIRDGLSIVVSGPPNVGKSSLINALSRRDTSIVSPMPGTTRDAIEVPIDLDGIAAVLIDTAGLRDAVDPIEAEGIRRARQRIENADLVLLLDDGAAASDAAPVSASADQRSVWRVTTKSDLGNVAAPGAIHLSSTTGEGLAGLRSGLATWARDTVRPQVPALLAHERHRGAFADAAMALAEAAQTEDAVLRAESLRRAAHSFGRIAGNVGVEDVLDRIFSRFCIGK